MYGKVKAIPAGALVDDPGVGVEWHAFVGSRAPWYDIGDSAEQSDGPFDHSY